VSSGRCPERRLLSCIRLGCGYAFGSRTLPLGAASRTEGFAPYLVRCHLTERPHPIIAPNVRLQIAFREKFDRGCVTLLGRFVVCSVAIC
jgi:hypothetical protein